MPKNFKLILLKLCASHIMVIVISLLIILLYFGKSNFFAASLGSCSYLLPQLLLLSLMTIVMKQSIYTVVGWFFFGEMLKTIVAACLCVFAIKYFAVNKIFVVIGFVVGIITLLLVYGYFSYKHYLYCE